MAIFAEFTENDWIKYRHYLVKGDILTVTEQYLENRARYDV